MDAFHSLGYQGANGDNSRPPSQPAPGQFQYPGAPGSQNYQQQGSSQGNVPPQNPYGGTLQPVNSGGMSSQGQGYFPQQGVAPPGSRGSSPMPGLADQMGSLGIGGGEAPARHKRRDRHAYHNLEPAGGSSQAFNGMPQGGFGDQSQFLNAGQQPPARSASPYGGQSQFIPATPSQVPAAKGPQNFAPTGAPTGIGSSSAQQRVDPDQIPSVPRSRDAAAEFYQDNIYPTMEQHLPPPATIPFVSHDQGNSAPKFARLTLNQIPSSADILASTSLPLGLVLQPLAQLQDGETPVPVLDFGDVGPPRCRRCRTYINPFMTFRSGGNKLVCNMCTFPNDVAPEYFAPTDPSGIRVDRLQRPELVMGTVEFTVPKEYWVKEPVGLRWLFLIDVGQEAVNRGFLEAFCEGVVRALYGDDASEDGQEHGAENATSSKLPPESRIGIVTFDKDVHFYNLSVRNFYSPAFTILLKQ